MTRSVLLTSKWVDGKTRLSGKSFKRKTDFSSPPTRALPTYEPIRQAHTQALYSFVQMKMGFVPSLNYLQKFSRLTNWMILREA